MTEEEQWAAMLTYAQALKASYGVAAAGTGIKGRFITVLVNKVCEFWEKHRDTLIPFLSSLTIAAFEALIAARPDINTVNTPGPR